MMPPVLSFTAKVAGGPTRTAGLINVVFLVAFIALAVWPHLIAKHGGFRIATGRASAAAAGGCRKGCALTDMGSLP